MTGYRWFTPEKASVGNALVYSMNCDVLSLLTRSSHYLIWGGSWAIRRDVFEQIGLRDAWKGTLSDDLVASRLMRRAGLKVRFEPACVAASSLDQSLGHAMSFIRRQYVIARLYTFDWWLFSFVSAMFSNLIWFGNLGVLALGLLTGSPSPWIPVAVSAVLYAVTVYRGWLRQGLVKVYFPGWERASRRIQRFDIWANLWSSLPIGSASAARRSAGRFFGGAFATASSPAARCKRSSTATVKASGSTTNPTPSRSTTAWPASRLCC